jgi:hypothetical protein
VLQGFAYFAVATLPESVDYTDKDFDTLRARLLQMFVRHYVSARQPPFLTAC